MCVVRNEMKLSNRKNGERGNTMIEFAVVMPFWITVLFGTIALGTNLTRTVQVVQISRDLADMYARGTDFSAAGFHNLITGQGGSVSLVQGMDLVDPVSGGGNAVIYLSQVRHITVGDADCKVTCNNVGKDVFLNQVVFGQTSLYTSFLGTGPLASDLDSHDNTKNPTSQTGDQTNQNQLFATTIPGLGATAYVVEVYVSSVDVSFLGYGGAGNYARSVF
jgi:hypothetical protein